MPVASGMWPPTMPWPPRKPSEASNRCIEPPLPPEQPAALPNSSAMTAAREHAAGQRLAVLAVGAGDVVVGPQRGEAADRDRLLADVEVAEAADLAEAVGLAGLLLEAADQQHLPQPVAVLVGAGGVEARCAGAGLVLAVPAISGASLAALGRAARACSHAW